MICVLCQDDITLHRNFRTSDGVSPLCFDCFNKTEPTYRVSLPESDPHGTNPHAPGAKLDAGKVRGWLCLGGFARALEEVAKVTTVGAAKYTPNGWMSVPDGPARYMDAFVRHALALGRGERVDADTGCLHQAQAIWNLLAALELELREVSATASITEPSSQQ